MAILYSIDDGPTEWPLTDLHVVGSKKYYQIEYLPSTVQRSAAYIKGLSVVKPEVTNGCMYECVSGGITATTTTAFPTEECKSFVDGEVKWRTIPLNTKLLPGDSISASEWTSDTGVTLSFPEIVGSSTAVRVDSVPDLVKTFTLVNKISVTRASGRQEEFIKKLIVHIDRK